MMAPANIRESFFLLGSIDFGSEFALEYNYISSAKIASPRRDRGGGRKWFVVEIVGGGANF